MVLPNMPQGITATVNAPATNTGPASVALSWTANPASDEVIEYRVYRTPAAWFVPETVASVVGTSCTDTSSELLPNTEWYYSVVAVNAAGISPPSATASAVIPQHQVSLALDGTAHTSFTSGSSGTLSLTTLNANDVIIAAVLVNSTTTSSINSAHLNFTLRKRQLASDGYSDYIETWYAVASEALSDEVITFTLNSALNSQGSPSPVYTANVFGIAGANTSAIFDSNTSLPAAVSTGNVELSTSNANDFIVGTYRIATASPTAGSGWTQIFGADNLLVEYLIVSATQSALSLPIGTGSGLQNGGIGDAIMGAA
jgi:hypothetical protein